MVPTIMRFRIVALFTLACVSPLYAKSKEPLPFAADLQAPQDAKVLLHARTNQIQYLGFNWVNAYCFGRVLGCAVSNEPATTNYAYHEVLLSAGDWMLYTTCIVQAMMIHACGTPEEPTKISIRKGASLTVTNTQTEFWNSSRMKVKDGVFEIRSAYNVRTRQAWGEGNVESWRMKLAATTISQELKKMSLDNQLSWARKLSDLKAAGLITADNLEEMLAQMQGSGRK